MSIKIWYQNNKPRIWTIGGVTLMWGAVGYAGWQGYKLAKDIQDKKEELGVEELPKKEIVKLIAKRAAIPVTIGAAGTTGIVGSDVHQERRIGALQAGIALAETAGSELKDAIAEKLGDKALDEVEDCLLEKKAEEAATDISDISVTGNGNVLFYEPNIGRFFRSSPSSVANGFSYLIQELENGPTDLNFWLTNCLDLYPVTIGFEVGMPSSYARKLELNIETKTVACKATGEAAIVVDLGCEFTSVYMSID